MRTFLLTIPSTPERQARAEQELVKCGLEYEVHYGIDKSKEGWRDWCNIDPECPVLQPGEYGCAQSHLNILKQIVDEQIPLALVVEDDLVVANGLQLVANTLANLPADGELMMLNVWTAHLARDASSGHTELFRRVTVPSYTTLSYVVSLEGARKLLEYCSPIKEQIDYAFRTHGHKLVVYQAKIGLFKPNFWYPSTVRDQWGAGTIPQRIYQVWFGGDIPSKWLNYTQTWLNYHPDWEHVWVTDRKAVEMFGDDPVFSETFASLTVPAQKSDFVRYYLIERGGIYIDTDFECFKNFDPVLKPAAFVYGDQTPGEPNIAFLGSTTGHPLAKLLKQKAAESIKQHGSDIVNATGPEFFKRCLVEIIGKPELRPLYYKGKHFGNLMNDTGILALDPWVIYPYLWNAMPTKTAMANAWAAHHWAKSWW